MPPTVSPSWTGGQYSMARMVLGVALLAGFGAQLAECGSPLPILGACCAALLVLGIADRSAAMSLLVILAHGAYTGVAHPSLLFALPLALHTATPPAPYLSWRARGRVDPAGGWIPPHRALRAYRILVALAAALPMGWMLAVEALRPGDTPVGWELLGLTSAFGGGLFAVSRRRGIGWLIVAFTLPLAIAVAGAPHHAVAAAVALLFAMDPAWIAPVVDAPAAGADAPILYYDGHCGLCHRAVRFCMSEDARGAVRFSALGSASFEARLDPAARASLPDSMVLLLPDGRLACRSSAAVRIMVRLGGLWRVLGCALWVVPLPLRDLGYRFVAAIRHHLFARPSDACPILPAAYRSRFLA